MRRGLLLLLAVAVLPALGGSCGGGSGSGGSRSVAEIESLDPRCAALAGLFPPGLDFVPGIPGRLLVANFSPSAVVPFDVGGVRPVLADPPGITALPDDSDGDGVDEGSGAEPAFPLIDDVLGSDPDLAAVGLGLLTASNYEEVVFFDLETGALREVEISVPAGFAEDDYPQLPAPGTAARRTALSTEACLRPDPDALDSDGARVSTSIPSICDDDVPSFYANFTSGVAYAAGRLFVSTANLGRRVGRPDTQFAPGSVLVYDVALSDDPNEPTRVSPNETTPVLFTSPGSFNATHVTRHRTDSGDFVLVSLTGALGVEFDDPDTRPIEGNGIPLSDSVIDVVDPATLEIVASVPLGRAVLGFDRLAIDPTGRVAVGGSVSFRHLYAVDLAPLASLSGGGAPAVLEPVFDATDPLAIPGIPNGASPASCRGRSSVAWNEAGTRVYLLDWCDGTLATIEVTLPQGAGEPVDPDDFRLLSNVPVVAPIGAGTLGRPRAAGPLRVRPGRPGLDFEGPDLFFNVGIPEGMVCAISIES